MHVGGAGGLRDRALRWWHLVPRTPAVQCGLYALYYALIALCGRLVVPEGAGLAFFWPAAGVSFLWLKFVLRLPGGMRSGSFAWSILLLAATTFAVNSWAGLPPLENLALTIGGILHPLVAAGYYVRTGPAGIFDTRRRMMALLIGAGLGALASVPFGPLVAVLEGETWWILPMWLLRQVAGTFLIAPLGLRVFRRHPRELRQRSWRHGLAITVVTVAFVVLTFFVIPQVPQSFLFVTVSIWVASTCRTNETIVHGFVLSLASIAFTLAGYGPFAMQPPMLQAALSQGLICVLMLTSLSIVLGREEQARLISQVRASEEATAAQALLMDRIIETMDDGLVVLAEGGDLIIMNDEARRLLDWPEEGWGDPTVLELLYDPQEEEPRIVNEALLGRTPEPVDVLPPRASGAGQRILSARAVPCVGEEGTVQVVVVLLDVTEQRRRTAELTSFAGVIAHDLLNPLGAVEGWTEMLEEEIEEAHPGLGAAALHRISSSAARMRGIISGLLSYSVAREGTLNRTDVDLGELVQEIVDARTSSAIATGAQVPAFHADVHAQVRVDRALVGQVLDNLVGNAAKYTAPCERPDIEISATPAVDGWVTVRVEDRGIGLPDGQEEAVFEEFHRVPEHRGSYVGTGLGLSICKRIIERHGGLISAHRREGGGSSFVLTLPASPASAEGPDRDALVAQARVAVLAVESASLVPASPERVEASGAQDSGEAGPARARSARHDAARARATGDDADAPVTP